MGFVSRAGVALCAVLLSAAARAELANCTVIAALPHTISAAGLYCLRSSLSVPMPSLTSAAIHIAASDVVVDLNGHSITASGAANGNGIRSSGYHHITVRNGTVRNFAYGVSLGTGEAQLVEDMRLEGNTVMGIAASGKGVLVRRNTVVNVPATANMSGIWIGGPLARVSHNTVVHVGAPVALMGITVAAAGFAALVERNVVVNDKPTGAGGHGIYVLGKDSIVVQNRVARMRVGLYFGTAPVVYADNVILGCETPVFIGSFTGTAAGGGNVISQ